tara:strand:+ start:154 stop:1008 length:855 start_codon:yes stop_codon:yes gene_type:complete
MGRKRNSERFGAPTPDDTSAPLASAQSSDVFSFITPTEFVDLPSEGRFYPEGHPLFGVDVVEIRHMTAKEEDILTSEALLRKGLAINRLLESVIVDKSIKIDDLLIGDKNAMLIASRITGFGPLYEANIACPSCNETNEKVFNLEELDKNDVSELPPGVDMNDNKNFTFNLPKTGATVEVRLLISRDEYTMVKTNEKKKKLKLPDTRSTDLLKLVLVSVNGHTDGKDIEKFAEKMPLQDVKYLRKIYEQVKPDVDVACEFTCDSCDHEGEVVMPLTAEFFWPNS